MSKYHQSADGIHKNGKLLNPFLMLAELQELELIVSGKTFSFPTVVEMNACKAEGIEEMLHEITWSVDEHYFNYVYVYEMRDYIDNLESKYG